MHYIVNNFHLAIRYCTGNPAYCRYHEGDKDTNLILVAGHDGPLRPDSIPDRGAGCQAPNATCIYRHDCEDKDKGILKSIERCKVKDEDDVETTDIAVYMTEALAKLTGKRPHLIISRIHRKKLDINREIGMGTFYVDEAVQAYNDVHGFIQKAKDSIKGDWGLILDIHGNNLPEKWTMLGYGVFKYQFDQGFFTSNDSTIKNLADHVDVNILKLLRGKNSLGQLMEEKGIKVIPSPNNPAPEDKNYLTGGYITKTHGSKAGGKIDALQIEIPVNDRDTKAQAEKYLDDMSEAIVEFISMNYDRRGARGKKDKKKHSKKQKKKNN